MHSKAERSKQIKQNLFTDQNELVKKKAFLLPKKRDR